MSEVLYLTKMSVKGLGCKPKLAEEGKPAVLCTIFGKADGIKVGEDASGKIWQALTGTFIGLNLKTGEEFRSGKLFLPSGIHETVENAVKALGENKEGLSVRFALELRAVVASNPIGYSYQAKNLLAMEAADEMSDIRKMIASPATTEEKTKSAKK
jgi:hypothetical protein